MRESLSGPLSVRLPLRKCHMFRGSARLTLDPEVISNDGSCGNRKPTSDDRYHSHHGRLRPAP